MKGSLAKGRASDIGTRTGASARCVMRGVGRLDNALSEAHTEVERILVELVREPSIRGERTTIDRIVERHLAGLPLSIRRVSATPGIAGDPEWSPPEVSPPDPLVNLVANTAGRHPPRIVLFAHVDTEPVSNRGLWLTPPFQATLRGGRYYGLGVADDKAGVASILAALRVVHNATGALPPLTALFVHGKQGGSLGTLPVWREVPPARAAVYCHPAETGAGLTHIKVASRGMFGLKATVTGYAPPPAEERTPLSIDPRRAVSAIHVALSLARDLRGWARHQRGVALLVTGIDTTAESSLHVPDWCEVRANVWFTEGSFLEHVASVKDFVDRRSHRDSWRRRHPPLIELSGLRANPARLDSQDPLIREASRVITAVTGTRPRAYARHAASDIRFPIRCTATPSIGLGALAGNFYGPNEWVDRNSMHQSTEVLIRMVLSRTGAGGRPR